MQSLVKSCTLNRVRYFILGKGSNTLFDDRGFKGLVIHNKSTSAKKWFRTSKSARLPCGSWLQFLSCSVRKRACWFWGFRILLPVYREASWRCVDECRSQRLRTSNVLTSIDFINEKGEMQTFKRSELQFSYSSFSVSTDDRSDRRSHLYINSPTTARQKQLEIISYRKKSQPLSEKSAGCIFRILSVAMPEP